MWLLFLALTLSAVAANPLSQKVTPGSILQMATTALSQGVTPGTTLQMATNPTQGVTPGTTLQMATNPTQGVTPGTTLQMATNPTQGVTPGTTLQMATNPTQGVTPGTTLQMATNPTQGVTPGTTLQMATNPLTQGVTPGSLLQKITPGSQQPILNILNVDQYLRKYGYMNDVNELSEDYDQHKTDAIKLFQRFASLPVTGITDDDTVKQMLKPRCGIKDINAERPSNARWNVTEFTYRFRSYTKDISQNNVRRAFVDGLSPWAAPSKLRFREITAGIPIMEVKFVNRRHPPCSVKMDGPGGVLAHAFFPSGHHEAGDMHLDDAETYKYKEGVGYELSSIVLHESGHALGLDHDYIFGSIMMPWYTGQTTLGPNDIKKIKELYA